jgi:RNA polymerase sigma-70 factor (ECF subfamily)
MVPITANGQPAAVEYRRDEAGVFRGIGIVVLAPTATGVARVVAFHDEALVTLFGFPESLTDGS